MKSSISRSAAWLFTTHLRTHMDAHEWPRRRPYIPRTNRICRRRIRDPFLSAELGARERRAAIKEARTTRVAGPHAEFQTSGEAQESCAAKFTAFRGRWSFFRQ